MKLLLGLVAVLSLSGCLIHRHHHGHGTTTVIHKPGPDLVVHDVKCSHTAHCGHYFHRGRWHHNHGHVHRVGCGHHFKGGIWVVVD